MERLAFFETPGRVDLGGPAGISAADWLFVRLAPNHRLTGLQLNFEVGLFLEFAGLQSWFNSII